jgi:hypothetical protein
VTNLNREGTMEDKVIVLNRDGDWLELDNCFLVGAIEYQDKVVFYKFVFSNTSKETRDEMLKRAELYLAEVKGQNKVVV